MATYRCEDRIRNARDTGLRNLSLHAFAKNQLWCQVVVLVQEPWDADLMEPSGDPAYRQALFGHSYGMLSFRVNEAIELISIFDITWIG